MFDVGFFELLFIGVVALLVVGPEKLPKLAKTAGMWIGRGRRFVGSVKAEIDQEIQAEELKKALNVTGDGNPAHSILEETRRSLEEVKSQTRQAVDTAAKPQEKSGDRKEGNADNAGS